MDTNSYPTIERESPDTGKARSRTGLADPAHIIIGGGPAGTRAAQELARLTEDPIVLFSDERWGGYNRVKLTPLLAREVNLGQIRQSLEIESPGHVNRHDATRIVEVDRESRVVRDHMGREWPYLSVIFACGSHPFRPNIPGLALGNVFTFRSLGDVEQLIARAQTTRHTVVIGGGLLGLEAARGMFSRGAKVTILENEPWLMARQLDRAGGEELARRIEQLGSTVRTHSAVRQVIGTLRVEGLLLAGGEHIACDTIVVCTGVRPNHAVARDAGLRVGRGITVDDTMRTSDPDIFAVGECAEFGGQLDGLVAPGLEQAHVAAINAAGGNARYTRREPTTRLKVVGAPVFSAGDVEQADQRGDLESHVWQGPCGYRRLLTKRGRLTGAIAVGEWDGIGHVQQLVHSRARVGFLALRAFRRSGCLPGEQLPASVAAWPPAATVCNCTGVTRGQLGEAIAAGCGSAEELARITSASTVCGTCKPLLQELTGDQAPPEPAKWASALAGLSAAAMIGALLYALLSPIPMTPTFSTGFLLSDLFVDGTLKQISGFTLLALSFFAGILSLRKRIKWLNIGDYGTWRLIHLGIGALAVAALVFHSGLRLGTNLNLALMLSFLSAIALGAAGGAVIAAEHRLAALGPVKQRRIDPRKISWWLHMLALWPLPLLLTVHILTVYFY